MTRREALHRTALLLGVALSPSGIRSALAAAERDPSAAPRHLSSAQFATTAALAERILPRTDTPGAIDVGVPQFIDTCFGGYMTAEETGTFAAGLAAIDSDSLRTHGQTFPGLTAIQQDAVLAAFVTTAQSDTNRHAFLRKFRETTLLGYFTSETVSTTVLNYDPVPGSWQHDIPLAETNGRAWAE